MDNDFLKFRSVKVPKKANRRILLRWQRSWHTVHTYFIVTSPKGLFRNNDCFHRPKFQISQAFHILSVTYSASSNFLEFQIKSRRENFMKQIKPILPFWLSIAAQNWVLCKILFSTRIEPREFPQLLVLSKRLVMDFTVWFYKWYMRPAHKLSFYWSCVANK